MDLVGYDSNHDLIFDAGLMPPEVEFPQDVAARGAPRGVMSVPDRSGEPGSQPAPEVEERRHRHPRPATVQKYRREYRSGRRIW